MTTPKIDIKQIEAELSREPNLDNIVRAIDAYLEQSDTRSLEKALSLVLRNMEKYEKEPAFLFRTMQVLALIKDNADAAKLAGTLAYRLIELEPNQAKWYVNAAYIHWRLGNLATAIELSEVGLNRLERISAPTDIIAALKANLAYYYAQRGLPENAEQARRLAAEAYNTKATASHADTLGYVLLRFATNRTDLEKAIKYLKEAQAEIERLRLNNPFVIEHLSEAETRLREKMSG